MKLSELIRRAQEILDVEGDIEVAYQNAMDGKMPSRVGKLEVAQAKEHYNSFFYERYLRNGGWAGSGAFTEPYLTEITNRPTLTIMVIR